MYSNKDLSLKLPWYVYICLYSLLSFFLWRIFALVTLSKIFTKIVNLFYNTNQNLFYT